MKQSYLEVWINIYNDPSVKKEFTKGYIGFIENLWGINSLKEINKWIDDEKSKDKGDNYEESI